MTVTKKQRQAYYAVKRALDSGELPPVQDCRCKECGKQATEYHHPDYDQPLNVVPLCVSCHRQEQARLKAEGVNLNAGVDILPGRNTKVFVRVSAKERQEMEEVAALYDLSVSDFLRRMTRWVRQTRPIIVVQPEPDREREPA